MQEILLQAGLLVAVIAVGYLLRRFGVVPKEAFGVVSKIVLWITLPAVVIRNFARTELNLEYLVMISVGFSCMALFVTLGWLINRRRGVNAQVFDMLNLMGFNIGCFALPYITGLLGAEAVVAVCMFDAGSALGSTGAVNQICRSMQEGKGLQIGVILKRLAKTFLLLVYLVMIVLRLLRVSIPDVVVRFCDLCGNANAFLAMLMIGFGMNLSIPKAQWRWIGKTLLVRYGIAIPLALCFWLLLPFSQEVRLGAAVAVLAPIATLAPPFTLERGGDYALSSSWTTLTILVSLALMTGFLLLTH
ncbi:MAG: AEC family transporter [Clostridia bacterium]|nr:AEC family transporter [Clostridia bacterium]